MIEQPYRFFGGVSENGKPQQFNGESRLQPKGRRQAVEPGGERPVRLPVELRQSYRRVGKFALIKHQRYAHTKQFKPANRSLRPI
jgi:hypothetical protein